MEALVLTYRNEPVREFPLTEQPLEVGSGAGADVVVYDPAVSDRHLLVRRVGLDVLVHDVRDGTSNVRPTLLLAGVPYPLGAHHSLVRVSDLPTHRDPAILVRTEPVVIAEAHAGGALTLIVGGGADARRVLLGARPLVLGSAPGCDIVVADRAVSARHCRIEPAPEGAMVRDLGSRNGTFVDGVRALVAMIGPDVHVRVGRTDLRVSSRAAPSSAPRGMVVASRAMCEVVERVERFAPLPFSVLVVGESGVGKEGLAAALHEGGPRRAGPFVAVNAGGMPRDLVESELFGHERGAFTGASAVHRGVFEQASGGTLFLDEIGELPLDLQPRLLRVLETGDVRRVGSETSIRTDVRLVCATHRDLRSRVATGAFRADLYFRLAQLVLDVPPLRVRPADVRALSLHFVATVSRDVGPRRITAAAVERLAEYGWPGNARELRNVIVTAGAIAAGGVIDEREVADALSLVGGGGPPACEGPGDLLERHGGNLSSAARSLGVARSTLRARIHREQTRGPGARR